VHPGISLCSRHLQRNGAEHVCSRGEPGTQVRLEGQGQGPVGGIYTSVTIPGDPVHLAASEHNHEEVI